MPNPYQWLLFDADDTLFDYQKAEGLALARAFERAGQRFDPATLPTYRELNHALWLGVERGEVTPDVVRVRRFEQFFAAIGSPLQPEPFTNIYQECLADSSELIDGANEVLGALARRYRCAIVTNGLSDVQHRRINKSPIKAHIEAVFVSQEVGAAKPSAAYFDAVFAKIGQPERSAVLIIGDSLTSDIRGGADYGLDTCWFNPGGKPRPDQPRITYEIARLAELVDLLA